MPDADVQRLEGKLDTINENVERLVAEVDHHAEIINGNGKLGLSGKVAVIWNTYVWVLCALSGVLGSALTYTLTKLSTAIAN